MSAASTHLSVSKARDEALSHSTSITIIIINVSVDRSRVEDFTGEPRARTIWKTHSLAVISRGSIGLKNVLSSVSLSNLNTITKPRI